MDFYTLTAIKFALGILMMIFQINILGKRDFSVNTPFNQVQLCAGRHHLQLVDHRLAVPSHHFDLVAGRHRHEDSDRHLKELQEPDRLAARAHRSRWSGGHCALREGWSDRAGAQPEYARAGSDQPRRRRGRRHGDKRIPDHPRAQFRQQARAPSAGERRASGSQWADPCWQGQGVGEGTARGAGLFFGQADLPCPVGPRES